MCYCVLCVTIPKPLKLHSVLGRLHAIKAPSILFQLVTLVFLNLGSLNVNLDMVEYFAGQQAVSGPYMYWPFWVVLFWSFVMFNDKCLYVPFLSLMVICFSKVTHAWARAGYKSCPFEIKLNPMADILSPKGFRGKNTAQISVLFETLHRSRIIENESEDGQNPTPLGCALNYS